MTRKLTSILVALSLAAGPALSQQNPNSVHQPRNRQQDAQNAQRAVQQQFQRSTRPSRAQPSVQAQQRPAREQVRVRPTYQRPQAAYQRPQALPHQWNAANFHRGERLPAEYRHRSYVVDDWQAHRLRRPPSGYHWVQRGTDYILVAIATGVILDLLLNR